MSEKYTYLLVNLCCVAVPFLFSFHPRLNFYKEWKKFIIPCLLTALFFLVWDALYTRIGVWGFNPDYVLGYYLLDLPLEEYMFFICIPFACVFSYHAFKVLFDFSKWQNEVRMFYRILGVVLLLVAVAYPSKIYTSVTCALLGVLVLVLAWKNAPFLSAFFFTYLFILIPFVLSNGVLTGSFLDRIVVYYNDQYNLGIRILTIPIEDVFYGMLLLLMNVWGYELSGIRKMTRLSENR